MAGPGQRALAEYPIPPGETTVQYAPTQLAAKILNFEQTPEGTLRSVSGVCPYEPDRDSKYNQYGSPKDVDQSTGSWLTSDEKVYLLSRLGKRVYGVFHAGLLSGRAPTLIARAGNRLYMHMGWFRGWVRLKMEGPGGNVSAVEVTNDTRPGLPDQFISINNTVVWTNGIDRPLVIRHDGLVTPLGYERGPGAPLAEGPDTAVDPDNEYANSDNYSWPGRIGTLGEFVSNADAALLDGEWRYYLQWEDIHGNLSPMSPASSSMRLTYQSTGEVIGKYAASTNLMRVESARGSGLLRQFVVRSTGKAPPHTVATRIYRTPDLKRFPDQKHLVERVSGTREFIYADNVPDSRISTPTSPALAVPVIHTMTSHAGALVVSNGPKVYFSEPGFPGTFVRSVTPDPDGAVVTGLASHAGRLVAFTERAMVDLTNLSAPPVVLSRGIGCDACRSIQAMPDGMLIWHSRDGFYGWGAGTAPPVKLSDPIHHLVRHRLNLGEMRRAVSVVDPLTREYRCAVTPAGGRQNTLMLAFDGQGWRELEIGFAINDVCVTDDARHLVLFAGKNTSAGDTDVFVFHREIEGYENPERTHTFRSAWLRADPVALRPIHIHTLYVGMIDEHDGLIDVNVYSNGSLEPDLDSPRAVKAVGTFSADDLAKADLTGAAVIGTSKFHRRRLYWRRIPIGLENINTWAFELTSTSPLHLAAFAFHTSVATMGDVLARIPLGDD
jgi:hypothetical protein